ncbi:hypothetical protein [Nodularia chucula]|uniref:hypothetical protein n=1 Tax=Nodularia chucula TaxID=3093667 RepID=UPI0039C65E09
MRIIEETHTRLKLQHRPINEWVLGGCLTIGGFVVLIYCLFFNFSSATLSCQRVSTQEINCNLQRSSFLGRRERLRIFNIDNVYVKMTRSSRSRSYRVIIQTPLGDRSMVQNQSRQDNERVVQEINNFLRSNQGTLLVQQNQRTYLFFVNVFTLSLMAYGVYLATKPVSNCAFYKSLNQLFIERKTWRSRTVIEEPLENILRVDIQDKQFKYRKLYRIVIVLKSLKEIPLNPEYTNEDSVRNAVFKINYFMGNVPE